MNNMKGAIKMLLTDNMLRNVRYTMTPTADTKTAVTTKKVQHAVPYKVGGKVVFF
ncbi:hypothetical protein FD27_GL001500 [Limosilactobacillus frumenti DSM 13145]|uniref:Uncharacterized protein n=1 Tax=Limosilactobacillus frumenti DSM 13145 TaxID=1423746 RepID=A0A0R1P8M7_9LACO|nr:hypothetical protein FD27_GL001500 [Limosilactobacillus frumenti DSM 13145]